ncbi:MAG: aryl-phospho-beta-D-glucosidase BglC (GH1 family) [Cyclobacteriaceae bacterium]
MIRQKISRIVSLGLVFGLITSNIQAQLKPDDAIKGMTRGINLGNTLEPPLEGEWNNGPAQEYYFDDYLSAGFTCVRVPVRWDRHTATSAPYAIDEAWMLRVEEGSYLIQTEVASLA